MKQDKKKINWKRTVENNLYMLRLIAKVCPGVLILALISTVLNAVHSFLLNTYLYQYALNALQEGKELKIILITLGCMFGYSVLYMLFRNIWSCYYELKYPKVDAYIQNLIQKKAGEVDLTCFENSSFYDLYVKATGEATSRAYTVMNNFLEAIWITINVVAVGTLIITIDPIFLILAFLPFLCTLFIGKKKNRIRYDYNMCNKEVERQKDYVRRTFYLRDFSKEMRLTEMWKVMFKRMNSSVSEMKVIVNKYGYKIMFFSYLFVFVFDVVVYIGTIILVAFKTLVLKNMFLGDGFVVINSISNVAGSVNNIGDVFFKLDENSLYVDKLRAFLEYEVHICEDENAPLFSSFKKLELKNMTFRYQGQEAPALSNINLIVNAGEKIAIVGHNGAGKTTLIKLLQRLYDPNDGEILLNGQNIKNYRLSSYRNLFGTVFQDYCLFATTVAENVMFRGNITAEDRHIVKHSLEKAGIYDKVKLLSNGVDSNVTREFDSEGAMFSGGEAQKISIAKIFAGKQEIVIMDEPTSALDPIAEQEMYRNMFEACEGKTVIFISHRLSSATMADRVYMFQNGEIIEQGTHSELLTNNGKYAHMWYKQATAYARVQDTAVIQTKLNKATTRLQNLITMRADGEITKDEYQIMRSPVDAEIRDLQRALEKVPQAEKHNNALDLDSITATLHSLVDFSEATLNHDIINKFVYRVTPTSDTSFHWYINLNGNTKARAIYTVEGRKKKNVIKLEEIEKISSLHRKEKEDTTVLIQNLFVFALLHRLLSRAASNC